MADEKKVLTDEERVQIWNDTKAKVASRFFAKKYRTADELETIPLKKQDDDDFELTAPTCSNFKECECCQ